jgi:hypothetical protein
MLSARSTNSPSFALRLRAGASRSIVRCTTEPDGSTARPSAARRSPDTTADTFCPTLFRSEVIESSRMARIWVPVGSALLATRAGGADSVAAAESVARAGSVAPGDRLAPGDAAAPAGTGVALGDESV